MVLINKIILIIFGLRTTLIWFDLIFFGKESGKTAILLICYQLFVSWKLGTLEELDKCISIQGFIQNNNVFTWNPVPCMPWVYSNFYTSEKYLREIIFSTITPHNIMNDSQWKKSLTIQDSNLGSWQLAPRSINWANESDWEERSMFIGLQF